MEAYSLLVISTLFSIFLILNSAQPLLIILNWTLFSGLFTFVFLPIMALLKIMMYNTRHEIKIYPIYDNSENQESENETSEQESEDKNEQDEIEKIYGDYNKELPNNIYNRMKYYETKSSQITTIPPEYPFIVRLDGRAFDKFLKHFPNKVVNGVEKPYSDEFRSMMLKTSNFLLHEFSASTVYTSSDEITLIFSPIHQTEKGEYNRHNFAGKVNKIISLISSTASASFVKYMSEKNYGNINSESNGFTAPHELCSLPTFDARLLVFPIDMSYEITNHMIWRSQFICLRNFLLMYVHKYIKINDLVGMTKIERVNKLKNEFNIDLDSTSDDFIATKYGVFLKHSLHNKSEKEDNCNNKLKTHFYVFTKLQFTNDVYEFLINKNKSFDNNNNNDNVVKYGIHKYTNSNYQTIL